MNGSEKCLGIACIIWLLMCSRANGQQQNYSVDRGGYIETTGTAFQNDSIPASFLVRSVIISGNKLTKSYIVERELAVKAGQNYEIAELGKLLRLTREQLMNTTLFVTVEIETIRLPANEIDIKITVKERWYIFPVPYFKLVDRNLNVWVNEFKASLDRTNVGLKVLHNNPTGRNDRFGLNIIGGYTQQFSFNYFQPYFDKKLTQGFNVGFSYARNREVNYATDSNKQQFMRLPEFARQHLKAEIGYSYRKGSKLRSALRVSYNNEKIDSSIIALNPSLFGNGRTNASFVDVFANFQYFNVDYIPFPLRGWYVDLYALKRISSSVGMLQLGGKMQGTWSFMPKTYLNFQGAFALTAPAVNQPFYNTRMLGYGSLYIQGLEYYVVDGSMAGMLRTTVRREVWNYTVRNLFKSKSHSEIPFRIFLKAYGNLGYAHSNNAGNSFMNNQLLRTGGFGLDIMTVYDMVLKLEYSFNQFGQSGFFIHTATDF